MKNYKSLKTTSTTFSQAIVLGISIAEFSLGIGTAQPH
jgi:hypothetical protein